MSDDVYEQFHLNAPRYSRRGVRIRELSEDEIIEIENSAAKTCGKDAVFMEVRNETIRLGIRRMLVAVTEAVDTLDGAEWHTLTSQEAETPSSPYAFSKLFRAKDIAFLAKKYTDLHEISAADVEALEGKASTVLKE